MTDADSAAKERDEKAALASLRLSVALAMHKELIQAFGRTDAAALRRGWVVKYSTPEQLAKMAVARADALLAQLERPWPSSEPPSMSPLAPI